MHLRHENLKISILGNSWLAVKGYLWDPATWQSWSQASSFTVHSLLQRVSFSVFGKTVVALLLASVEMLSPDLCIVTCCMYSSFQSRKLGFSFFLGLMSVTQVTSLQWELAERSWRFCLYIKHHCKKLPSETKKWAQAAAAWTYQMLWLLFWLKSKWICVLEKEDGPISHIYLRVNHGIIIWKMDIVTLLNRKCLYLCLMKCVSGLVNW